MYKIIRYYRDERTANKIIKKDLTLEEAKFHCSCADTKKEGVYFEGFVEQ